MQFQKKTSIGKSNNLVKLLIKIVLIFSLIFIFITLIDKIDFPAPEKKIEKLIKNENFKIIK